MLMEFIKLMAGLLLAFFHQPIADYILQRDLVFVALLRQRGLSFPAMTQAFARNVYFTLGIFVASFQIVRIWLLMRP